MEHNALMPQQATMPDVTVPGYGPARNLIGVAQSAGQATGTGNPVLDDMERRVKELTAQLNSLLGQ